jgi:hypothetical protein
VLVEAKNNKTNAMEESKALFSLCGYGDYRLEEAKAYVLQHPEVDPDAYKNGYGLASLHRAAQISSVGCVDLLLDQKANIDLRTEPAEQQYRLRYYYYQRRRTSNDTALILSCSARHRRGYEDIAFLLLERGANIHLTNSDGHNALYYTMSKLDPFSDPTTFVLLCCGAKTNEVKTNVTCIDLHRQTHTFIEDNHRVLTTTLSTLVKVDTRLGVGDNGIYQEPLERALEYMGMSMNKNQTVNTSIDGGKRRVLIPGQPRSAKYWHHRYFLFKLRKSTRRRVYGDE